MRSVRAAKAFALAVVSSAVVACTAGISPASTPSLATASPTPTTTAVPSAVPAPTQTPALPTAFVSPLYGYSLTVPAGWQVAPATARWDGSAEPGHEEPVSDRFLPLGSASFWAYAGPVSLTLDAFVKDRIAANARDHGDTCPATPDVQEPITVAGEPAVFLAWNCGILINHVVMVHGGVGYSWLARDPGVHAATAAADRAILDQLLASVTLPG
jgi:hypothetical protein